MTAGTVGLIFVLNTAFQRLSRTEFEALAKSNAEFIRTLNFPLTEKLADYFSQINGAKVHIGRVDAPDERHEAVTVTIAPGSEMTLIRVRPSLHESLLKPVSLTALAVFWALWFLLACAVVRALLKVQRMTLLGQMTTGLAHEIRNPVAAIRLHSQLLAKTEPEAASLITDQATTIERLLNQWMFLARPEPPRKTEMNLSELLRQSVRLLSPAAEHAQVHIILDVPNDQRVSADASRLSQAFHNIILNAIQAMPAGGTLCVSANHGSISFADTGPGFSPTALRRWSEMLFSEKEGGMGVGLTVAQEIIRAHGGELSVGNRPEGGAIVQIKLLK